APGSMYALVFMMFTPMRHPNAWISLLFRFKHPVPRENNFVAPDLHNIIRRMEISPHQEHLGGIVHSAPIDVEFDVLGFMRANPTAFLRFHISSHQFFGKAGTFSRFTKVTQE